MLYYFILHKHENVQIFQNTVLHLIKLLGIKKQIIFYLIICNRYLITVLDYD